MISDRPLEIWLVALRGADGSDCQIKLLDRADLALLV